MPLLSIEEARTQCRVDGADSDVELAAYVDAAADAVAAYLNRAVYADATSLAAALGGAAAAFGAASSAYDDALVAAQAITNDAERGAAVAIASAQCEAARVTFQRTMDGIVASPSVTAAARLIVGHLYANRESVLTGARAAAVEIPMGVHDLLRPYRKAMMP